MNKLLIGIIGLAVIAGGFLYISGSAKASIGSLNIYNGEAEVARGNETVVGSTGVELQEEDIIKVGVDSRVSIILKDGSIIRLEAESEVEIVNLAYDSDNKIQDANFKLITGEMWSRVEALEVNSNWQVETPTMIASVRGTAFNTKHIDNVSNISVYLGTVGTALVDKLEDEKLLNQDEMLTVRDDNAEEDFAKDPQRIDRNNVPAWIIFNIGEDEKISTQEISTEETTTPEEDLPVVTNPIDKPIVPIIEPPVVELPPQTEEPPTTTNSEVVEEPISQSLNVSFSKISGTDEQTREPFTRVQFVAFAIYDDQSTRDVTLETLWQVSGNAGGTINQEGLYIPTGEGEALVRAEFEGISGVVQVFIP